MKIKNMNNNIPQIAYKFIKPTMEYYYFGEFYIRIHEPGFPTIIGNYSLIQSSKTEIVEKEFEYLKQKNLLIEINKDEFFKEFERAILILRELIIKI